LAALVGREGTDRLQFLSGEPFELRVSVEANGVPPPRLQLELRDDAGVLVAGQAVDLRGLGWANANGARDVRFRIDSLPLADGRFHLRLGLTDEQGDHVYHWRDDALVFVVYPGDDVRGVVRFEGTWMLEENSPSP
jgi:Wzt C-terminal domain